MGILRRLHINPQKKIMHFAAEKGMRAAVCPAGSSAYALCGHTVGNGGIKWHGNHFTSVDHNVQHVVSTVEEYEAQGYRLCGHCRNKKHLASAVC